MLLGLGDDAVEPLSSLSGNLTVQELGNLTLLAVDQGVQTDIHVPRHAGDFGHAILSGEGDPRLQRTLIEELLDAGTVRNSSVSRGEGADRSRCNLVQDGRL